MKWLLPFLILLVSVTSQATIIRKLRKQESFQNIDCELTDSCSLKEFSIRVRDVTVILNNNQGENYLTETYLSYTTDGFDTLEDYGIVQFIRGAQWSTHGADQISFDIVRAFFGEYRTFVHEDWIIDSIDTDPMYNSREVTDSLMRRHDYYRWNGVKDSFEKETERYYFQDRDYMTYPTLYVRDIPGTTFYSEEGNYAKNSSLEFLACIYKTKDIPVNGDAYSMDPKDAIKCFPWKSISIFNYETMKFESPSEVRIPERRE